MPLPRELAVWRERLAGQLVLRPVLGTVGTQRMLLLVLPDRWGGGREGRCDFVDSLGTKNLLKYNF